MRDLKTAKTNKINDTGTIFLGKQGAQGASMAFYSIQVGMQVNDQTKKRKEGRSKDRQESK